MDATASICPLSLCHVEDNQNTIVVFCAYSEDSEDLFNINEPRLGVGELDQHNITMQVSMLSLALHQ